MANGLRKPERAYSLQELADRGDLRPIPDPTILTTQAQKASIEALREIIETRFEAMDIAIKFQQDNILDKIPLQIKERISQLQELHEEKFLSISNQFTLRDVAVAAALKAAQEAVFAQQVANKEANSKMEVGFVKQIDSSRELLNEVRSTSDGKIEDIKTRLSSLDSRLTTIESNKIGMIETKKGFSDNTSIIIGVIALLISITSVLALIFVHGWH